MVEELALVLALELCGKESADKGVRTRALSEGSERRANEDEADVEVDAEADEWGGVDTFEWLVLIWGRVA